MKRPHRLSIALCTVLWTVLSAAPGCDRHVPPPAPAVSTDATGQPAPIEPAASPAAPIGPAMPPATAPAAQKWYPMRPTLPRVSMQIGNRTFTLEVANNDFDRRTGLKFRPSLPHDHGMIFIMPGLSFQAFYNENVEFGLDLLFLDRAGKVVDIKQLQRMDPTTVWSDAPAVYVIELNLGTAEQLGVTEGDVLALPQLPEYAR